MIREYFKLQWAVAMAMLVHFTAGAQSPQDSFHYFEVAYGANEYTPGYDKQLGGEAYSYQTLRGGFMDCVLTRSSTAAAQWETGKVHKIGGFVEMVWLAALDVDANAPQFTLNIDGTERFAFDQKKKESWTIKGEKGSELSFFLQQSDQHGDAHGVMYLKVPAKWVKGAKAQITVSGDGSPGNHWFMVFKENNTGEFIHNKITREGKLALQFTAKGNEVEISCTAPGMFAGKTLQVEAGNARAVLRMDKAKQPAGKSSIKLNLEELKQQDIKIFDARQKILAHFSIAKDDQWYAIRPEAGTLAAYTVEKTEKAIDAYVSITYEPEMIAAIHGLGKIGMHNGVVALMNSSHQDIAWMDDVEKCIVERDTMLITPILRDAVAAEAYSFDIEDALIMKEYLARHPESKEVFQQLLEEEKISIGASYMQPYEEMYSGEALARQFYLGKKWIGETFDGYNANTYWNMDVPGRTLQMPQIMAKAGVENLVISRQAKGIYKWSAPNGNSITAFSLDHYALDFVALNQSFPAASAHIAEVAIDWMQRYNDKSKQEAIIPIMSDWDMSPAKDYTDLIAKWHNIRFEEQQNGSIAATTLPPIELMTTDRFIERIAANSSDLMEISGERPNLWVYIHGPSHQRAVAASRAGDRKLIEAEMYAAFDEMVNPEDSEYPEEALAQAWSEKIYPDHGWGGKNGDITDAIFKEKYESALHTANAIATDKYEALAGSMKLKGDGMPIVVFNTLNWEREELVSAELQFKDGEYQYISLTDNGKQAVNFQLEAVERYPSGHIRSAQLHFVATIPGNAYASYFVNAGPTTVMNYPMEVPKLIETPYFKARLAAGGMSSLIDKKSGRELLDTENFKGAEIFTMNSVGNGAGEFVEVQQPDFEGFEQLSQYNKAWKCVANGPVFADYETQSPLGTAVVTQRIRFYKALDKIDIDVAVRNWDGTMYREYRMALPLASELQEVAYEVPYGLAVVGQDEFEGAAGGSAAGNYVTPNVDIHPRGIVNWIGAAGEGQSVVLSSSVVAADYIDVKDAAQRNLQPILFASRHSCHWEGNPYPQTGDHEFQFSIQTGKADWVADNRKGIAANHPLQVVVKPRAFSNRPLKATGRFLACDDERLVVSAIKKAEDGKGYIVRAYNTSGEDLEAEFSFTSRLKEAQLTNLIEEDQQHLEVSRNSVSVPFEAFGIVTFRVIPDRSTMGKMAQWLPFK